MSCRCHEDDETLLDCRDGNCREQPEYDRAAAEDERADRLIERRREDRMERDRAVAS